MSYSRGPAIPRHCLFIHFLFLAYSFWAASPSFAINIRQENHHSQGVLVSRPNQEDMEILKTLYNQNIQSLEDYAGWLQRTIHYQKDSAGDIWAAPLETIRRKNGDCEDYAFLSATVARVMGFETQVLAVARPGQSSHAICVIKKDGYYHWFDNGHFKKTQAQSLDQLAVQIMTIYPSQYLMRLDFEKRRWDVLYRRTS